MKAKEKALCECETFWVCLLGMILLFLLAAYWSKKRVLKIKFFSEKWRYTV